MFDNKHISFLEVGWRFKSESSSRIRYAWFPEIQLMSWLGKHLNVNVKSLNIFYFYRQIAILETRYDRWQQVLGSEWKSWIIIKGGNNIMYTFAKWTTLVDVYIIFLPPFIVCFDQWRAAPKIYKASKDLLSQFYREEEQDIQISTSTRIETWINHQLY